MGVGYQSIISCQNLVKRFGPLAAVGGVTLDIHAGQCVGLLGPNGAGKSTFISLVYGATPKTSGALTVFGMEPGSMSREIKKRVGVVTQEDCLDESMTVHENMTLFAKFAGVPKKAIAERVNALLKFMSLFHKSDASIKALSGGMKRRLVFVRALLSEPELVILDEPTTGLDPAVRHLLWEKVLELKNRGVTVLLTTHYMDEAERLCDRVVIMDEGVVCEDAPPRQLIAKHCPGVVAHFRDKSMKPTLQAYLDATGPDAVEVSEDVSGIGVRGPDIGWVSRLVGAIGLQPESVRPANLEDVFLKVTGRGLGSNA